MRNRLHLAAFFILFSACQDTSVFGLPSCMQQNYDSSAFRVSPGGYTPDVLTHDVCKQLCSDLKFPFVGLVYGEFCLCSNHTADLEEVDSALCDKNCVGNGDDICGSNDTHLIYVMEADLMGTVDAVQIDLEDVEFFMDAAVKISLAVQASTDFTVRVSFGDGTSHRFSQEPYEIEKFYRVPGQYKIRATAVDIAELNPAVFDERDITVYDKTMGFEVDCPPVVEPKRITSCNLTVFSGTQLAFEYQMTSEDETYQTDISDVLYFSVGPAIPPEMDEEGNFQVDAEEVFLPHAKVQFESNLLGFELFVKETGTLQLRVLSRDCGPDAYCEAERGCSSSCSSPDDRVCDDKALCSYIGQCADPDSPPSCFSRYQPGDAFKEKYSFKVAADQAGYMYHPVPDDQRYRVAAGDVIGFSTGGGAALWCRNATDEEVADDLQDTTADGGLGVLHYLRAVLAESYNVSLQYMYNQTGNQSVYVGVSNVWSEEPDKQYRYVPVQVPLSGVTLELNRENCVLDEAVTVTVLVVNGSDVTIMWSYYDGTEKDFFEGDAPESGYTRDITCSEPGDYTLTVNASNLWSFDVVSVDFHCFSAIGRDWTFASNSPKSVPPGDIDFSLEFDGSGLPSSAVYVVDFGDGDTLDSTDISPDADSWKTFSHTYGSDGNFTVVLNISNPVDSEIFQLTVQVFESMGNLTVEPFYVLPGTSYPEDKLELKNRDKTDAPKGATIYFENSIQGHVNKYIMSSEDGSLNEESPDSVISREFQEVGEWEITFRAYSSELDESSNEVTLLVRILEPIQDVDLAASSDSVSAEEEIEFTVAVTAVDDFTCVVFKSGDGSRNLAFGNEDICLLHYSEGSFRYIDKRAYRKKRDVKEAEWVDESTIRTLYEYVYGGDFMAAADVFNSVSRVERQVAITVLDGDYINPLIWIDENSTDVKNPLMRQRAHDFRIETTAIFRDEASYLATQLWTAFKVDESGNELEEVDLSDLKTRNCSALRVVKRHLDIGLYKFVYTLTVYEEDPEDEVEEEEDEQEEEEDFYSLMQSNSTEEDEDDDFVSFENRTVLGRRSVYTFLEIVPTPLIPMLLHGGASYILRGFSQSVLLEPTIYSEDPDYPEDKDFEVEWFCLRHDTDEQLKELGEFEYDTSNPSAPITDRSSVDEANNEGGCFGKGPGLMDIGNKDYELKCSTLLQFDAVYEIVAVVRKGGKVTEGRLLVEVVEKDPPSLRVRCEKRVACFPQVQGQYINPNSFIPLKTDCLEDCGEDGDLTLEWTVYSSGLRTLDKNPIDSWSTHTTVDMDRMGINQTLFATHPDVRMFLVEVTGLLPDPQVPKGLSSMLLIINNPPENGNCRINSTSGMALLDVFFIEFSNWDDQDGHDIADYSIYVRYGDESLRLSYGLKTKVEVVLPYGDIQVWCSISDSIGGTTFYSAANFTTALPTEEELEEYEERRFFDKCLAEGKMSLASQIVIAKNSIIMEYKRRRNQSGDFDGVSEAAVDERWEEFLEQDGIDSSYFTVQARDEVRELLTEQLEQQMDADAKSKNKEIGKLVRLPMEALPDAEIFGGALGAVAENGPSDMKAKLKLMKGMDNMFDVINDTEVSHPEDLKIVVSQFGNLADSIAGSLADAGIGGHFVPSEVKRAEEVLNYNATEPNYFIYYVEGDRQEVRDRLEDRAIDAAKESQADEAKEMVTKIKDMISSIQQGCMEDIMVGPDPFYTQSKGGFQMTFLKNYASNLTGSVISQGSSSVILPDMCKVLGTEYCDNDDAAIGVQSVRWTQPLESYGEGSGNLSDSSNVIQVEITPRDGSEPIPVTDSAETFIICIPHSGSGEDMERVVPRFTRDDDVLVYHTIFVEAPGSAVVVSVRVDDPAAPLVLLYKHGEQPYLQEYDDILRIKDVPEEDGVYKLVIDAEVTSEPGRNFSLAIGQLSNAADGDRFFSDPRSYNLTVANMTNKFTTNYSLNMAISGCYYFDENSEEWSTKGCKVFESTTSATCCECNHLTSFGSGFFVTPNEIDFSYVFANAEFKNNVTIYATIIVVFSVFVLLLIFARWKDRKDLQKLGATPLPDNEAGDKYIYEILIFTGHQRNAGTKSNVFFIVSGEDDETEVRHLADDKRPILQKGSADVFVMSVPRSLGQLNYLRIWHDNSGTGRWSSWYCQYIVFRDVQTGLKYEFLVNRWFALEKDDGLIDRLIPVAGREQVTEFSHLFSTNSRRNLADRHLWFSVFLRPPRSRFTRVQRVCCCMAVLCLSMLANAMYYQRTSAKPTSGAFKFGPLSLSPEQIAVGIVSNFLVFPPTFVMIFFFRKSRPRKLRPSRLEVALKKQRTEWKRKNLEKPDPSVVAQPRNDEEAQLCHRKKRFSLPWWCVYFGWLFVVASIGASMFFLWAYGIEFGDEKTSKWLSSLVIAFFSSVLITQPLKILLMAIVMSCLCRSIDYDEDDADEDEEVPHLKPDEEFLHNNTKRAKKSSYRPMDLEALEEARKEREKEVKMYNVIQEICAYFFFLWIIMILSYGNRDPNNFYFREALINGFIKPGDLWVEFNNVNTERRFWNWTYNALVPELFALPWYNGRDPLGLRLYLDDRNNLKIGYGVMRQVRIKPKSCKVSWLMETLTPECSGFGSVVFEDGTLYTKGWRRVTSNDTLVPPEYKYLTASQLRGYPFWGQMDWYGGGGYVVPLVARRDSDVRHLLRRLERLERDGWIDKYTRAVFVEFGVYNAQINLFCAVTILAEFLPGGGVVPYYHIDPLRLLNYHTGFGFFQMIVEIAFVIFTIFFTVKELRSMCREGRAYFREYWNIAEVVSIVTSYTGIANHFVKMFVTAEILRIFNETEGTGYVKLQEASLLNDLFCYQLGLIMSISTLKFLKLLRFNKRVGVLSSTLRKCAQELQSYAVCLMVVFVAFVILFWLLLGRFIREFSTFLYSFESSISMMLKKFNYDDMYAAQPVFTPIAFFAFSLATAVVLINILLTIIIRSFEEVKHDATLQSNEYEIMDFFLNRLKMVLGCGTAKVRPLPSMYRDKKVTKDTVSSFPDKVDRLVDFINEFYFENQMDFNGQDFLKKLNAAEREKRKAKPVKAKKSKIPKSISDRFDDF